MMKDMTVTAKQLRPGDRMHATTVQGKDVTVLVNGVLIDNWSTKQDHVKVFTRGADFEYGGDELVQIQRGL